MSSISPVSRTMNGINTIEATELIFDDNTILTSASGITDVVNSKINSVDFNTTDGVLTLTKEDTNTITKDLDGRYFVGTSLSAGDIPDLNASKITAGTLAVDRIPDLDYVETTGDETISGVKTFSSVPKCSTQPSSNDELANKQYVDANSGGTDERITAFSYDSANGNISITQDTTGTPINTTTITGAGITTAQANAIITNTAKVGITTAQANAIITNTAKVGITTAQANAITTNTAKVGITTAQANAITTNTAKVGITTGSQSISGIKTFSSFPAKSGSGTSLNPSSEGQFATKKYVDDNTGGQTFYGFSAYASIDDIVAVGVPMYFNEDEENDGNLSGSHLNGTIYTVAKKGFYFIHAQVYVSSNNAFPWIQIVKEKPSGAKTNLGGIYQETGGLSNANCGCVAELEVNDKIYATPRTSGFKLLGRNGQIASQGIFSNFSAFIITET